MHFFCSLPGHKHWLMKKRNVHIHIDYSQKSSATWGLDTVPNIAKMEVPLCCRNCIQCMGVCWVLGYICWKEELEKANGPSCQLGGGRHGARTQPSKKDKQRKGRGEIMGQCRTCWKASCLTQSEKKNWLASKHQHSVDQGRPFYGIFSVVGGI